ncbi:putative Yippee family protein [Helianthus annuus]|nr:putative Yippee family protein [Helianthus annuus]
MMATRVSTKVSTTFGGVVVEDKTVKSNPGGGAMMDPTVFQKQAFQCKHGKAYLFSKVTSSNKKKAPESVFYRVNVIVGVKEDRLMMTGLHTVAYISASNVDRLLDGHT